MIRRATTLTAVLLTLTLVTACDGIATSSGAQPSASEVAPATTSEPAPEVDLGQIPSWTGPFTGTIATAEGINPPTNTWIAPAVFAPEDRPVFTGVLSARLAADTVTLGLPRVTTTEKVVMGAHPDDLPLGLEADAYTLTSRGAVSATFGYSSQGEPVGDLVLAEGWPYASYRATVDQQVGLPPGVNAEGEDLLIEVGGTNYRLVGDGGMEGDRLSLGAGQTLVVYAEPEGAGPAALEVLRAGAVPLVGSELVADVDGDEASTTLRYLTEGGVPTVMAVAPAKEWSGAEGLEASYATVLGDAPLVTGTEVMTTAPVQEPVTELDLSGLTAKEQDTVEALLEKDVESLAFASPDSYHGGKELQRAANLYLLARQLEQTDLAATVREGMVEQLDLWFDPMGCAQGAERCFRYDAHLGGMVGEAPAYGSDEFNDHHFHYGHLLYAAGVLAEDDQELADRWAPVADLVALDYGAPTASAQFPQHRAFDAWRGHSFASGTAPFADGNNQESSSEAVNGYAGLLLWARARGDEEMVSHASWLLSNETESTLTYWLDPELDPAFGRPIVSLNWQGKRDFATFFSAEPSAVTGIQLIPMNPTQLDYLARRPEAVQELVATAGEPSPEAPLSDYVLMASAVTDPEGAAALVDAFDAGTVDNGTSISYLTALVLSR